jgi:predicted transcriptional regulator
MEVIRVIKNKNYTTISNQLFKNKTISLKAKGLMAYLLSLPNEWELSINGIVACSKEGRAAISSTIKELIESGYIERETIRDKGKFVGYDYFVFEQPKAENPITDKPITDNRIQISKEVIKERINKNTLSKSEKFKAEVFSYEYPKDMLNDFYSYWSEPRSKTNKRMRWEYQPTFEIGRRLKTWAKREKSFKPKNTMSKIDMHLQSQKKAEKLLNQSQIKNKTQ